MAKKRTSSRKPARARSKAKKGGTRRLKSSGDSSRLDTAPLQEHIRRRIKELENKAASRSDARQDDDTLNRLRMALDTLEDICAPTMTIPI